MKSISPRILCLVLLLGVCVPARAAGWFRPPEESISALCSQNALATHPGKVVRVHAKPINNTLIVRVYVEQNDGQEWIIFCDARSGRLEKSVLVDDLFQP